MAMTKADRYTVKRLARNSTKALTLAGTNRDVMTA